MYSPSGEQIPAGFTPEVWGQLTPQQKAQYLQAPQQPVGAQANQQEDMMKTVKKTMILSMVFGFITSIVTSIFHMVLGRFLNNRN